MSDFLCLHKNERHGACDDERALFAQSAHSTGGENPVRVGRGTVWRSALHIPQMRGVNFQRRKPLMFYIRKNAG